jgi:hypothetical protein
MIDKSRFFDAFPAGNYAISGWLRLMDFQETHEVKTAAIQSRGGHVILVNPDFVARYAPTPERQVTLVLHELMHLLLGHQLRPVTKLDNLVFDAIINAMLCRILRSRAYWSLFTSYYSANRFPECLLRPPANFDPDRPVSSPRGLRGPAFNRLRAIYRDLYGKCGATYSELRGELMKYGSELLCRDMRGGSISDMDASFRCYGWRVKGKEACVGKEDEQETEGELDSNCGENEVPSICQPLTEVPLLGDHPVQERDLAKEDFDWFRHINVVLHPMLQTVRGRFPFGVGATFALPPHPATERENTIRVTRLIKRVAKEGHLRARRLHLDDIKAATALPALDRKSNILRFLGLQPLLYTWEVPVRARKGIDKVHLYIDVSGSVFDFISSFYMAALRCRELVQPQVHLFSTSVAETGWQDLLLGEVKSTWGTDINCVLEHMRHHRVRRAVILTDGAVGHPRSEFTRLLENSVLGVALAPQGYRPYLEKHVRHWEELQAPCSAGLPEGQDG